MGYQYTKGDEARGKSQMLSFTSARAIVRRLRLTSQKEWYEWSKSGQRPSNVPGNPSEAYKGKGWVSWPDWMGYKPLAGHVKGQMLSFLSARAIVRRLRLTSQKEWWEWSKSGQRPSNVPSHPDQAYQGKGWVSMPDWMGYKPKAIPSGQMLPFLSARAIVRRLRLTSAKEWWEWSKSGQRPSNVPGRPDQAYQGKGWVSYPDWMGYQYTKGDQNRGKSQMLPFTSARAIVRRLRLTSQKEWKEWSKSGQRPGNVPGRPDEAYKGKGWVSWPDWMGYQYTKGDENKKKRKRKRVEQKTPSAGSSSSSSSSPPLDNCAICFEPLCPVTTEIGHLACVHTFHVDCINGHARASATPATTSRRGVLLSCPLCRKRTRWLPPPPED
eukprot:g4376.t1